MKNPLCFDYCFNLILLCHQQEVLLFPAMKPDDPNKPKEDATETVE